MSKRKPNWLLRSLLGVSLSIHLIIFMYVAGIYRSNALSYIELTLQDVSKPPPRSIPRPRRRPKAPQPVNIKSLNISQRQIPSFKPFRIEPAERDLPNTIVEGISMADIGVGSSLSIADWSPGELGTSGSYLEMVRLKIEQHKSYPEMAKTSHIEGRVIIRFVISPEGDVRELHVAKSSNQKVLDVAALRAVKEAAPFPKPPRHLFEGEIPLELTIVFELT
jgi:protein TonB